MKKNLFYLVIFLFLSSCQKDSLTTQTDVRSKVKNAISLKPDTLSCPPDSSFKFITALSDSVPLCDSSITYQAYITKVIIPRSIKFTGNCKKNGVLKDSYFAASVYRLSGGSYNLVWSWMSNGTLPNYNISYNTGNYTYIARSFIYDEACCRWKMTNIKTITFP